MRRKHLLFIAPAAIAGLTLLVAIGGFVVRELWNWLMPSLFGLRTLTFWQAVGMLALARILFGGLGRGGGRGHRRRRCQRMTPEERERFRDRMRVRFESSPPDATKP